MYVLPDGNPVVSGTLIRSEWANNTMNDVARALTDSLDRLGNGRMLAPLKLDGSTPVQDYHATDKKYVDEAISTAIGGNNSNYYTKDQSDAKYYLIAGG